MKRIISILILISILFFICQWTIGLLKKEHEVSYKVYFKDEVFEIKEIYKKELGNKYDISIKNRDMAYSYIIDNNYNKQKKIIKEIKYYNDSNNNCIYPILESGEGTYIQCNEKGKTFSETSYPNQNYIAEIKKELIASGYYKNESIDFTKTQTIGNNNYYPNALIETDIITVWNYKGIDIIDTEKTTSKNSLAFDKYENTHGYLVGKYYIVPNYLSSKVLEFSSVNIINIENKEMENLELNYTLSSNTYINGVINEKLYYTDPSNLLQIEINPAKKNVRLIGSKELGGQLYQGEWENTNIYDFATNRILFTDKIPTTINEKYSYEEIIKSDINYYFYNNKGEVYRVSENNLNTPVLLFKMSNLNNFKVINNNVYFVVDNTLYYFSEENGIISILKNNELRYNTLNRINIYRKS